VKIDYSQSAGGHGARGPGGNRPQNDGTRDIGNSQAPVVLLRGLDSMTSMEAIAEALRSSSGAANQGAIGMKRIVLIRDRLSAMCIGLAFVEFVDADVSHIMDSLLVTDTVYSLREGSWPL
jgi:RNA-binding protein 5/10